MEQQALTQKKKKTFISKLRGDRVIWLVLLLLAMISIAAVYSSSSALAYRNHTSTFSYLIKQMSFVFFGFVALIACYRIPLGLYRKLSYVLLGFSGLLLIYTIFKGTVLNQAGRWIAIGGVTFQPSELAKIAVVIYLARILESTKFETFKEFFLKILLPVGAICALCLQGSFSAALLIGVITLIILLCAGVKKKFIWLTVGIAAGGLILVFAIHLINPEKIFPRLQTVTARVERFFVKDSKIQEMSAAEKAELKEKTYQAEQAVEAIQLGGIIGRGPGNSIKRDTLPHPYSDFIYASIIEEWGLLGGIAVLMLYLWFFFRCIVIARSCTRLFSTIVVLGLSLLIIVQAFLHILVNVGILPVTGQTLPLISQGGTSYVIMSCAFGIILAVNRTIEIKVEQSVENQNHE